MVIKWIFFCLSVAIVFGGDIKLNPCPPGRKGKPDHGNNLILETLKIQDCDALPCKYDTGHAIVGEMKVIYNFTSKLVRFTVMSEIPGFEPITYFDNKDTCELTPDAVGCKDVKPGTIYEAKKLFIVPPLPFNGIVRFIVRDDFFVSHFCGELTAITSTPKNFLTGGFPGTTG